MKHRSSRIRNVVSDQKLLPLLININSSNSLSYSNQIIEGRTFKLGNFFSKDFSKSILTNVRFEQLDLSSAIFTDAVLNNVTFINCSLFGVDFGGCTLKNVNFIEKSTVSSCSFFYAFLENVSFESSTIENIKFNFYTNYFENDKNKDGKYSGLNFKNAILNNVDFSGIEERILRYPKINFNNAKLTNVNLSYSRFKYGNFVDAYVYGNSTNQNQGDFESYNYKLSIYNTNLFNANLSGARFKLDEINVYDFEKVDFDGTTLVNTIFENIGFREINFSSDTKFGDRNSLTATTFINCKYDIDPYIIKNILII